MTTRTQRRHPDRFDAPGVVIAYMHPGETAGRFTASLASLLIHDGQAEKPHICQPKGGHMHVETGPRLAEARTQVCLDFLANEAIAQAEFLFLVDSDMTFDPDTLDRLVAQAEAHDADVMGALCFAGGITSMRPTIYRLGVEDNHPVVEVVEDYPRDAVVKVGGTGAACILIRRRILEAILRTFARTPDGRHNPYPFFAESFGGDGRPWGEDIQFCLRVQAVGGSIFVDTSIKTGHVKHIELTEELFDRRSP